MTNYDHLITLSAEEFNNSIISIVNQFGGNSELLLRYLNSEYVPILTIRDVLNENFNLNNITFRYFGSVYECVSVDDFLKRYGTNSEPLLNLKIKSVRTGKNGNKTIFLF